MIFVDSSAWIDYFDGIDLPHTNKLDRILGVEEIAVGDVVVTEVLQGYSKKREFNAVLEVLSSYSIVIVGGRTVSVEAARNYITLRSLGFTIRKTIDTMIATRCILSGYQLLHNDRDFTPFEKYLGLKSVA